MTHFVPFFLTCEELRLLVKREAKRYPIFRGITAQGWPYCPGVGRLDRALRVPGGLIWWREEGGCAHWMWQPLRPGE
ncbi:hypothetical protein [Thermus hydrothermalis]|uniref:hypothetical protein n=1 Tax=Thermus hydrothermalis TaxID=2908148 RepID=UPI001FA97295|nr:hypothetical protein [Thermus hydrothermalis]